MKQFVSLAAQQGEADDFQFCLVCYLSPFPHSKGNTNFPFCSLLSPEILSTKEKKTDDTIWQELCAFVWPGKEAIILTQPEKNIHKLHFLWFLPQCLHWDSSKMPQIFSKIIGTQLPLQYIYKYCLNCLQSVTRGIYRQNW